MTRLGLTAALQRVHHVLDRGQALAPIHIEQDELRVRVLGADVFDGNAQAELQLIDAISDEAGKDAGAIFPKVRGRRWFLSALILKNISAAAVVDFDKSWSVTPPDLFSIITLRCA